MMCEECGGKTKYGVCVDPGCGSPFDQVEPKYDLAAGALLTVTGTGTLRMTTTEDLLENLLVQKLFETCNVCGYARKFHDNGLFPGEVFIEGVGMISCGEVSKEKE